MKLKNRTIVVTGAGGGIGRAIALYLGGQGANVVVNDYGGSTDGQAGTADLAGEVASEIAAAGGSALANGDAVGSRAAAESIRDAAIKAFGRIDGLVNNAGIMIAGRVDQLSDEQVDKTIEVNYLGPYRLVRAIWPGMREGGHGRIVNVSSNSAFGYGQLAAYGSSKAALLGLTADLAQEGKDYDIRVNSILPVSHSRLTVAAARRRRDETGQRFEKWLEDNFLPSKIAPLVGYLVSDECAVSGKHFTVGGGRFAPIDAFVRSGFCAVDLNFDQVVSHMASACASDGAFFGNAAEEMAAYTMSQ